MHLYVWIHHLILPQRIATYYLISTHAAHRLPGKGWLVGLVSCPVSGKFRGEIHAEFHQFTYSMAPSNIKYTTKITERVLYDKVAKNEIPPVAR